jgi:outer membrane protein OmpA-like peptidoglycan-associated protein
MNTIDCRLLIVALVLAGCATAMAPEDLVSARTAYDAAEQGTAAKYSPSDLLTARHALDAAEKSFAEEGDSPASRDLAYTANRRVQIAEARANTKQATESQKQNVADMHANQSAQLQTTTTQLGRANQQLQLKDQQLATETAARTAADQRATQAAADLAKFASVKQEARGMVITLSGGVLFASSKSDLLPAAQSKLNGVAQTLIEQEPNASLLVEGHTDSKGGESYNQDLSQRRAQTVRDYLVSRGIGADRVTAQGFGSSRSIADNASADGRANNRRVEIVVGPERHSAL